jgi:probable F420-dependent oxidoreductase
VTLQAASPSVRLSIITPVLTMLPGAHARWEQEASIAEVARVAEAADRLGYHHLTCSEHVAVPVAEAGRRGATYWDPLATFGYLAARTESILLATNVLVLGYHHPLAIAKRYGTLDRVSGGRLVLGVGVGTLREEFDLLGASFEDRGPRADDALRALRVSLSAEQPAYHGPHVSFEGLVVDPRAVQDRVPIWVGGRTLRSLRRAVALADGWCPFAVGATQARDWLGRVEPPPGFEVVLGPSRPLDPGVEPEATLDALGALVDAGTTIVRANFVHRSLEHYLEQLEALAELVVAT